MKKQIVLDLSNRSDLDTLSSNKELLDHYLGTILKLPAPIVDYITANIGSPEVLELLKSTLESKYNTESLYAEKSVSDNRVVYSNVHPHYAKHPLTVEEWISLVDEQVQCTCPNITAVEDGEYILTESTSNEVVYKMYRFRKHPNMGYVLRHSCADSNTSVRLYLEDKGCVFYAAPRVYGRSSGRYNKVTDSYYPESVKMLILSLSTDNVDDLVSTLVLLRADLNLNKVLSLEEIQSAVLHCKEEVPNLLKVRYSEIVASADDIQLSDPLWRCTNFKLTVGDVLSMFESGTPKNPEIREFLGSLLSTPVISERLYKE